MATVFPLTHFTRAEGGWMFALGSCPGCRCDTVRGKALPLGGNSQGRMKNLRLTELPLLPPSIGEVEGLRFPVCPSCRDESLVQEEEEPAAVGKELPRGEFSASAAVKVLEEVWKAIRRRVPEIPPAVVVLASGTEAVTVPRYGHWAASRWRVAADGEMRGEVLVAGEALAEGPDQVMSTLLHEAAHALAHARGEKDASRQGRYHNLVFKRNAESLGLEVSRRDPHGFCRTVLPPSKRRVRWAAELEQVEALCAWGARPPRPPPRRHSTRAEQNSVGRRVKRARASDVVARGGLEAPGPEEGQVLTGGTRITMLCQCDSRRRIRVVASVAALGEILCGVCQTAFRQDAGQALTS